MCQRCFDDDDAHDAEETLSMADALRHLQAVSPLTTFQETIPHD
jgi:hypothetical protein